MAVMEALEELENQEDEDLMELQALLGSKGTLASMDRQGKWETLVRKEVQVHQDFPALKEFQALLDL